MRLKEGDYYVGDLGCVLPNDDLRHLFAWNRDGVLTTGYKFVEESAKQPGNDNPDIYWIAKLLNKQGTMYGNDNTCWGFDWGCFGVLPWKWVTCSGEYENNKIKFAEPFECFATEDKITIGHLEFTVQPK